MILRQYYITGPKCLIEFKLTGYKSWKNCCYFLNDGTYGINKKDIKIHSLKLYVKGQKYGKVINSASQYSQASSVASNSATESDSSTININTATKSGDASSWLASVLYTNARSIVNKLKDFWSLVYAKSFDIIGISETWLTNNIYNNEILLLNYILFCKDHLSWGGHGQLLHHARVTSQTL